MNKEQVVEKIGKARWKEFLRFMKGQTAGINKGGTIDYCDCDVENFLRNPKDRFFD